MDVGRDVEAGHVCGQDCCQPTLYVTLFHGPSHKAASPQSLIRLVWIG
jgi:hypothetical protein